jgi:hypothetical protein
MQKPSTFLISYEPLESLWSGQNPLFQGEQSARWQIRQLRKQLEEAEALAIWCGKLFVHRRRFEEIAEREAIRAAARSKAAA